MRDRRVDVLRAIGLLMIVFAHTEPSEYLLQLRNFDVPLMVIVSGLSFGISYKGEPYSSYVWKRVKRLVFPVWLFLTCYFSVMYLTAYPSPVPELKVVATSFLFLSGIGYVWVIRVFLLVALESPFILKFHQKTPSHARYFLVLAVVYVFYEMACFVVHSFPPSGVLRAFEDVMLYAIPYGVVFAIGLRIAKLDVAHLRLLIMVMFSILMVCTGYLWQKNGGFVFTQNFKYPPQLYYLSYGLLVSCTLWLFAAQIDRFIGNTILSRPVQFLSQNSIWVYLWHIPFIEIVHEPYFIKYPLVLAAAMLFTFVQVEFVHRVLMRRITSSVWKTNVRTLLTG